MKYEIYAIYDRVSGAYGAPQLMVNEGTARRWFNYTMQNSGMIAADCALYRLGSYDTDTGFIVVLPMPEFICNFGDKSNED